MRGWGRAGQTGSKPLNRATRATENDAEDADEVNPRSDEVPRYFKDFLVPCSKLVSSVR